MTDPTARINTRWEPHLPECWMAEGKFDALCMCDRLRACKERVLDAAREAVLGVSVYRWPYSEPSDEYAECITVDSALAAIDALREETK